MMSDFLQRIQSALNIQPKEAQQVFLLAVFALLPSVGGAIGSPGIEALFYSRFGVEFLPYMYIALGALTMVSTLSLTAALNRIPKSRLYRLLPIGLAALLILARFMVSFNLTGFYPILWLGMYLFWTLQALFVWGIAGMLFNTRQAKRLFPLFAASSILGSALGGLVTGPLVAWLGAENLLLIWALSLVLAFFLAWRLTRAYDPPEVHYYRPKPTLRETLIGGGATVLESPLLRWLSIAIGLLAILLFALAFPFSKAVAARYPDENAVAGFLGVFQGVTTTIALIISVAFANRLYARVGLMGALLVFALIYAAGFGGLIFITSFYALVAFRFAQQAWRMSVADTAYQASFNIIPPDKREPARMFVDGIPRQIGVALSGLLLLTVQPVLSAESQYGASAVIAALTVLALMRARAAFTGSLADALAEEQVHIFNDEQSPLADLVHDHHALEVLLDGLKSEDVSIRQTTVEILARMESPPARDALRKAYRDVDPHIRTISLNALAMSDTNQLDERLLLEALDDQSAEVRSAALQALPQGMIARQVVHERLERMLADSSQEVQAQAAARLLREGPHRQAENLLGEMARSGDPQTRRQAMLGYGAWGQMRAYEYAAQALKDDDPVVRRMALESVTGIDPERCLESVKYALGDSDQRVRSTAALSMAKIGPVAVPIALQALRDPELESGALTALKQLPIEPEEQALVDFIQRKTGRALEMLELQHNLQPGEDETDPQRLLINSLHESAQALALTALEAYRLISHRERVSLALIGLESSNPDQRANAIELLESLDEDGLIKPILRIWETGLASQSTGKTGDEEERRGEVVLILLGYDDAWLRACAAFAAVPEANPKIRTKLLELSESDPDPIVRETAAYRAHAEENVDSISTLPVMERILFLKKVPLFAQLSPEELKQVASIAGEHIFKDEETFIHEGELGDEMYIIVSGQVRVVKGTDQSIEIARRGAGEFVGEMSVLTHEPRMASLVAEGDVFALCIEQSRFEHILLEKPEIGLSVMRALIQRLKDSREHPVGVPNEVSDETVAME